MATQCVSSNPREMKLVCHVDHLQYLSMPRYVVPQTRLKTRMRPRRSATKPKTTQPDTSSVPPPKFSAYESPVASGSGPSASAGSCLPALVSEPKTLSSFREEYGKVTTKRSTLQARQAELRTRKAGFEKRLKEIMDEKARLWDVVLMLEGEAEKEEAEVAAMEVDDRRWEAILRETEKQINGMRQLIEG
ncbi:hypothetical protein H0H93_006815 [Arthromyces matolae]|nr:hypothetical protein H0H93_006815 [Arthromyces matolae]